MIAHVDLGKDIRCVKHEEFTRNLYVHVENTCLSLEEGLALVSLNVCEGGCMHSLLIVGSATGRETA
jgi:hypothetical protein